MSKAGARMAVRLADIYIARTGISKAYGARQALAESFAFPGEVLAKAVSEKQKTIRANSKLIKQHKRLDALQQKVPANLQRALDIDYLTLPRAEAYASGSSRLVPFEPDAFEITRKTENMIQRHMRVNGSNGVGQENI